MEYRLDSTRPNNYGLHISDSVDIQPIDNIQFSVMELLDAKSMMLAALNTNSKYDLYGFSSALRIKATCHGRKLTLAPEKGLIVLPPGDFLEGSTALYGDYDKRRCMRWSNIYTSSVEDNHQDFFAEQPLPKRLPLYTKAGLANPFSLKFANGQSVQAAVEFALWDQASKPSTQQTSIDLRDLDPHALVEDESSDIFRIVKVLLGANGLAREVMVFQNDRPIACRALEVATRQIQWDVTKWNLQDTLVLDASRISRLPPDFGAGSGVDLERVDLSNGPHIVRWGKMVHYLEASVGTSKSQELRERGSIVDRIGWIAVGKEQGPTTLKGGIRLKFAQNYSDAKIFVLVPDHGIVDEKAGPINSGTTYWLWAGLPEKAAAKLVVIAYNEPLGPSLGMLDIVIESGIEPKLAMVPMTWGQIERELKRL